jgi:hypothetical protein
MKKYIREGKVAVLYSPGWGAGWSTWNSVSAGDALIFDPEVVEMLFAGVEDDEIIEYCERQYPDGYFGGVRDLEVEWVPVGTQFKIEEYDGNESILYKENTGWITA